MKVKTVILVTILVGSALFLTLSLFYIHTINNLNTQAQSLAMAEKRTSIAKELKVLLLDHNRSSLIYAIEKKSAELKNREVIHQEIMQDLSKLEKALNNAEESQLLTRIREKASIYIDKREELHRSQLSPIEQYTRAGVHVNELDSLIEELVSINEKQMRNLMKVINSENRRSDLFAMILLTFAILTLIGLGFLLIHFFYRPIVGLSNVMLEYKSGNDQVRAKAKGLKEVQAMASSFNSMAEDLKRRRQDQLRFIASIAHDLKNPLSSMSMATEMLLEKKNLEDSKMLNIIQRQVQSLIRLVGDLLDTARIEADQLEFERNKVNIVDLIEDSIELFKTNSKLHVFETEIPREPIFCYCDRSRISQVVNNFITNAIKYSPNGGIITIKVIPEGDRVHISVSDQGIGIAAGDLEDIFKPFHRTKETKFTIPGIGLGLSTCQKIIEGHGGKIEVLSRKGEGSTFQFSLPISNLL